MANAPREPNPGEVFADVHEWMASGVLLQDQGHELNVEYGEDEDTQRFVADVRRANRHWRPGQVPRVPLRFVHASRGLNSGPRRGGSRDRRPRARRVQARSGASRDGPDPDPEPPLVHTPRRPE